MSARRIDLYCLCWNEARIIPHFLRHYLPLVDRIFVFDNGSTDNSLALLSGDERVRIAHFDVPGDSFVDEERRLSDAMWKPSRGEADWVAVVDMDEQIYHPDLLVHLNECRCSGITAIQAVGYEMVSSRFPARNDILCETITNGFRYPAALDKFCLFDPDAITLSNFAAGRHGASPKGRVVWDSSHSVKLLHYKKLGLDYYLQRTAELRSGLRPGDIRNGWGAHYSLDVVRLTQDFRRHHVLARSVPGLRQEEAEHEIHLVVHGARISPMTVDDNLFWFALPPGATAVRIVSRCATPFVPSLGVSVESLILWRDDHRCEIPLDSPELRDGWWGPATGESGVSRWTDGNALLVVAPSTPDACILEVRLTGESLALVR
jgi:Glycosyl transferase family 2